MTELLGWFADRGDTTHDAPADAPWMAFVQVRGACLPLGGIWFLSEEDCWAFIRDELAGLPALEEYR